MPLFVTHTAPSAMAASGSAASPQVFYSRAHPGAASWPWVFTTSLIRPLTVCMLPIMIGALVTVLQGFPALVYLTLGFPLAVLAAMGWTYYRLVATPAELHVRPGAAAIRTVWATVHDRPLIWRSILELRTSRSTVTVTLSDAAYELARDEWPDTDDLLDALQIARSVEPIDYPA